MDDLEKLARERFDDLSEAELKLLHAVTKGETAYYGPSENDQDPNNDPENADSWGANRQIRAELLRWLCVERNAQQYVDPRGIQVHAAKIIDGLDLSFSTVPFPFIFHRCRITHAINLTAARIKILYLSGSWTGQDGRALSADRVKVEGCVFLRNGFTAKGEVRLVGATVGESLDCDGASLENPEGPALSAERVKVEGNVHLREGFTAKGELRMLGATIGGDLDCTGASLENPSGDALNADGAKVEGHVFLRGGFRARGVRSIFRVPSSRQIFLDSHPPQA